MSRFMSQSYPFNDNLNSAYLIKTQEKQTKYTQCKIYDFTQRIRLG